MSDEQRKYAEYPPGHPRHGISPTRPMQTMASRYCSPFVNPDLPVIHPETVDRRCPSPGCGEYVNRECWRCGWLRPPGDPDLRLKRDPSTGFWEDV